MFTDEQQLATDTAEDCDAEPLKQSEEKAYVIKSPARSIQEFKLPGGGGYKCPEKGCDYTVRLRYDKQEFIVHRPGGQ